MIDNNIYILDKDGNPVPCPDVKKWAKWFEKDGNRVVALNELPNGVSVSTVFLGIDYNAPRGGKPILWETMIFNGEYGGYQKRYTSLELAKEGHKKAVNLVRGKDCPPHTWLKRKSKVSNPPNYSVCKDCGLSSTYLGLHVEKTKEELVGSSKEETNLLVTGRKFRH